MEPAGPWPLAWTREKPTEPGWYWFHQDGVGIAGITEIYPAFGRLLMFEGDGSSVDLIEKCKWAGPIPEPAEQSPLSPTPNGEVK